MWDARHGGFFWEVDAAGTPTEAAKHMCGHAYALDALAEYARASGRVDALAFADEIFDVLEERAHDRVYGGYVEWFAPDWTPGPLRATPLGDGTARAKLTGTHMHAMEAMAAFCRVSPRCVARNRLAELIAIQTSAVVRKDLMACRDRHDRDWTPRLDPNGDRRPRQLADCLRAIAALDDPLERVEAGGIEPPSEAENADTLSDLRSPGVRISPSIDHVGIPE